MAIHIQSAFGAGELDPALQERTTLDKYKTGLKTLRNAHISKTGRIVSRSGSLLYRATKSSSIKCTLFSPRFTDYLLEVGTNYLRIHDLRLGTYSEDALPITFSYTDLPKIQFSEAGQNFVYMTCSGFDSFKITLGALDPFDLDIAYRFVSVASNVGVPSVFGSVIASYWGGSGYLCDYIYTYETALGEESFITIIGTHRLPRYTAADDTNNFTIKFTNCLNNASIKYPPTKLKIYRRPSQGSAYGFIGSIEKDHDTGNDRIFYFNDFGQEADYTHNPPNEDPFFSVDSISALGSRYMTPAASIVFQKRLIVSGTKDSEFTFASRTNFNLNFGRDYPLNATSALSMKAGLNGARVLRYADLGALAAFTTAGLYMSPEGALTPETAVLIKRGNWVIDEKVAPLKIPGAVIFVDRSSHSVVSLEYDDILKSFTGSEITIFSNHLFRKKNIVNWAYQEGEIPLVWVVFDDGTMATLTYHREHQMMAWARHDTDGFVENIAIHKSTYTGVSTPYVVVTRSNGRYLESFSQRYVNNFKFFIGMDSAINIADDMTALSGGALFTLTPDTPGLWSGTLSLTSDYAAFSNVADEGAVGTVFRVFGTNGSAYDLTVTTYTNSSSLKVTPSMTFPSSQATSFYGLYKTHNVITGLSHLNGKKVSVFMDGYVESSPLNTQEAMDVYTVASGQITLNNNKRGAIISVGIPYAVDIETLDVDTVEQKPTLVESIICNKTMIKLFESRGMFIGSNFGSSNTNDGMADPEFQQEILDLENISNAPQLPYTRRLDLTIPGDWKSQGRICIRQVDPLPLEILSIIPDIEVEWRTA